LNIKTTVDENLISSIMSPILPYILPDEINAKDFKPLISPTNGWIIVSNGSNNEGIVYVEQHSAICATIHPYFLGIKGQGRKFVILIVKWLVGKGLYKINVSIASVFKLAINTTRKIGFVYEGVNRNSFLKDGKYLDQLLFGLTKPEIEVL